MLVVALRMQSPPLARFVKAGKKLARHRRSCPSALAGLSAVSRPALTESYRRAKPSCPRMTQLPTWRASRHRRSSKGPEFSAPCAHWRSSLARRKAPRRAVVGCSTSRLRRLVLLRSSRSGRVNNHRASRHSWRPRSGQLREPRLKRFRQCLLHRTHPRPNPSVEARPNGKPACPPPACAYHPSGGQAASPSTPPHLER